MTDPRASLRHLVDSLGERVDLVEVEELLDVGELHVGFETLSDHVYDADIALTPDELRYVDALAVAWAHDPAYHHSATFAAATLRASGPRGPDGRWPARILTVAHFEDGDALRRGVRLALGLPGAPDDELPAARSAVVPHVLDLHDWDILCDAHPVPARSLLEWLLAAPDLRLTISDSHDAAVDPAASLRSLSTPGSSE